MRAVITLFINKLRTYVKKEMATHSSIPCLEMATHSRIPCLENSTDRGAWQTTVHGVAKSWPLLSTHT